MENQLQLSENPASKYEHNDHSVGKMMMHLEWCTKYRYKMFRKEEYRNLITACIRRAASLHQISMIEINVQKEHVHCVVSVSYIIFGIIVISGGVIIAFHFKSYSLAILVFITNISFSSTFRFSYKNRNKNYFIPIQKFTQRII